jgi:hypothetical protein
LNTFNTRATVPLEHVHVIDKDVLDWTFVTYPYAAPAR